MKRRSKGDGSLFFSEVEKAWIGTITLPDGKKKRKRSKRKGVVREWLQTSLNQIRDGTFVENDQYTVSSFLDRHLQDVWAHTLRPKTLESYEGLIRLHIRPEIGNIKLKNLRPDHLQTLYARKLASGLSRRSVEYIHAVLHKALVTALKWGLVARNVADAVEPPKPDSKPVTPLTIEQAKQLFTAIETDRLRALWLVAIGTGLRRGELLALTWDCVDLETGLIQVKHNLVEIRGKGLVMGEPKSESSRRPVALPDFALKALKRQYAERTIESRFVFCTKRGTPFSPRNTIRYFKEILKRANLPPETRIHDLRHTFISWLLAAGQPPKDVQAIAGHAHFQTTMDLYAHIMPGAQIEAAHKISQLLK